MNTFADWFRQELTTRRLTTVAAAKKIGVSQSDVSRLRSGKRRPTLDTVRRIERAWKIRVPNEFSS